MNWRFGANSPPQLRSSLCRRQKKGQSPFRLGRAKNSKETDHTMRHIFAGIDLGDKKSVARIGIDNQKDSERLGFVNTRAGRRRLFSELKRRSQAAGGAKIVMAYKASSCGFVLRDEAQ